MGNIFFRYITNPTSNGYGDVDRSRVERSNETKDSDIRNLMSPTTGINTVSSPTHVPVVHVPVTQISTTKGGLMSLVAYGPPDFFSGVGGTFKKNN
jgi:hypothetical protein